MYFLQDVTTLHVSQVSCRRSHCLNVFFSPLSEVSEFVPIFHPSVIRLMLNSKEPPFHHIKFFHACSNVLLFWVSLSLFLTITTCLWYLLYRQHLHYFFFFLLRCSRCDEQRQHRPPQCPPSCGPCSSPCLHKHCKTPHFCCPCQGWTKFSYNDGHNTGLKVEKYYFKFCLYLCWTKLFDPFLTSY